MYAQVGSLEKTGTQLTNSKDRMMILKFRTNVKRTKFNYAKHTRIRHEQERVQHNNKVLRKLMPKFIVPREWRKKLINATMGWEYRDVNLYHVAKKDLILKTYYLVYIRGLKDSTKTLLYDKVPTLAEAQFLVESHALNNIFKGDL